MGSSKRKGHSSKSNSNDDYNNDKNSDDYRQKRLKNNDAVKRSRDKSKKKAVEATDRVKFLQSENENLRSTVEDMTKELRYLKEVLICQAGTFEYLSPNFERDLDELLREDIPTDFQKLTNVLQEMRRIQNTQQQQQQSTNQPSMLNYDQQFL